ncbi:MAG: glycosyltransferase [Opitutaceae bacterium]|jgi:glycosyltransferase involved in cell wall biosynthesis|nr:glycosyltransferase [Opitutaceae bacterium]
MRILYASDVVPADTTSGAKVMHRHLVLAARSHEVLVARFEDGPATGLRELRLSSRRWMRRGLASRRRRHFAALDACLGLRAHDAELARAAADFGADLVLTVAEGGLCHNARRVARRLGLPLAVVYHDWSPDWRDHPRWSRDWIERAFIRLHRESRTSLCVSAPLLAALGERPGALVLPPLPDPTPLSPALAPEHFGPAVYAGVLNGLVEPEVRALAAHCLETAGADAPLRFFGPRPHWGDALDERLARAGLYLGFQSAEVLQAALSAAACLLVIMPFGAASRRFTRLSFPSKLVEYTHFGRPIVVWGPADCSAALWARETGAAMVVSDPDPRAAMDALTRLSTPRCEEAARLGKAARQAYETLFRPSVIHERFEAALLATLADRSATFDHP